LQIVPEIKQVKPTVLAIWCGRERWEMRSGSDCDAMLSAIVESKGTLPASQRLVRRRGAIRKLSGTI